MDKPERLRPPQVEGSQRPGPGGNTIGTQGERKLDLGKGAGKTGHSEGESEHTGTRRTATHKGREQCDVEKGLWGGWKRGSRGWVRWGGVPARKKGKDLVRFHRQNGGHG